MTGNRVVKAIALAVSGGLMMGMLTTANAAVRHVAKHPVRHVVKHHARYPVRHTVKKQETAGTELGEVGRTTERNAHDVVKTTKKGANSLGEGVSKEAHKAGKAGTKTGKAIGSEFRKGESFIHKTTKHITR